jgi:ribosome biogenesis GTPase
MNMTPEILDRLRPIGCTPPIAQALAQLGVPDAAMRVAEVHRDSVVLHDGCRERRAQALPRLARELAAGGDGLAVGDWVLASEDTHGAAWISARMPPLSQITRRSDSGARQCLVTNVDTALIVMGLDGDFNLRRLERYLAMVQGAGVWPVVLLTKRDLAADPEGLVRAVRERVPAVVPLHALDARAPDAAAVLGDVLAPGQTLVLLGSSGTGKSTLTNALLGRAVQATGAVRADDSRGRHTTTVRSLHLLPGGACVIDTPGLRGLQADLGTAALEASFADLAALAAHCRYRDCSHTDEPDCAVRAGLHPDRLANFHKMKREIRRDSMSYLDRRRQLAEWKARSRGAELRARLKRG